MRTLWLVCRGNELMRYTEMPDEVEDIHTVNSARHEACAFQLIEAEKK